MGARRGDCLWTGTVSEGRHGKGCVGVRYGCGGIEVDRFKGGGAYNVYSVPRLFQVLRVLSSTTIRLLRERGVK